MKVRARLDRIERAAGTSRCPHCNGPLPRVEPVISNARSAERLVALCKSVLAERQRPENSNRAPLRPEAPHCPHCGKPLPASDTDGLSPTVEEIVAALIVAERQMQEPAP